MSVLRTGSRGLHTVPDIGLKQGEGIPGLFSAKGVDQAWFEYQNYLLSEINSLVETRAELDSVTTLFDLMASSQLSNDATMRKIAALSSQAYNNEFFFRALMPSVNPQAVVGQSSDPKAVDISNEVLNRPDLMLTGSAEAGRSPLNDLSLIIDQSFQSLASMRELLIDRADKMFGNGSVWLIHHNSALAATNCYGWASPYSHEDLYGNREHFLDSDTRLSQFVPILCLNAWQHTYLHDYGVTGKRDYLKNLFDCVEWRVVASRMPQLSRY